MRKMIRNFVKIAVLLRVTMVLPLTLQAEQNCLEEAANKIKPGSSITIIRTDNSKISGTFLSLNLDRSSLMISPFGSVGEKQSTYEISEFAKIQYRKTGKFKPEIVLISTILGAGLGYAIGKQVGTLEPGPGFLEFRVHTFEAEGAGIGAAGSFLIGTIISLATKSTFTIECK